MGVVVVWVGVVGVVVVPAGVVVVVVGVVLGVVAVVVVGVVVVVVAAPGVDTCSWAARRSAAVRVRLDSRAESGAPEDPMNSRT